MNSNFRMAKPNVFPVALRSENLWRRGRTAPVLLLFVGSASQSSVSSREGRSWYKERWIWICGGPSDTGTRFSPTTSLLYLSITTLFLYPHSLNSHQRCIMLAIYSADVWRTVIFYELRYNVEVGGQTHALAALISIPTGKERSWDTKTSLEAV